MSDSLQDIQNLISQLPNGQPSSSEDNSPSSSSANNSSQQVQLQYVHHQSADFAAEPKKKRQKYSRKACANCRKAHSACADERPCYRCKRKGIPCDLDDVIIPVHTYINSSSTSSTKKPHACEHNHELGHHRAAPDISSSNNNSPQETQQHGKRPRSVLVEQPQPSQPVLFQENTNVSTVTPTVWPENNVDDFLSFLDGSSTVASTVNRTNNRTMESSASSSPDLAPAVVSVASTTAEAPAAQPQQHGEQLMVVSAMVIALQQQQQQLQQQQEQYRTILLQQEQLMQQLQDQKRMVERSEQENQILKQLLAKTLQGSQLQSQEQLQQSPPQHSLVHHQQQLQHHQQFQQLFNNNSLLTPPNQHLTSSPPLTPSVFSTSHNNIVWSSAGGAMKQIFHNSNKLNSFPIFWSGPVQFSKKTVSFWDKRSFVMLGCNAQFTATIGHDLAHVQNNFTLWDLCPRNAPMQLLTQFFTLIANARAKTVTLKTLLCTRTEKRIMSRVKFHLEDSFFWCESDIVEYLDDEVYLDDKKVLEKTYEVHASELTLAPQESCLNKKYNIMNRLITCLMSHKRDGLPVNPDLVYKIPNSNGSSDVTC